MTFKKLVIISAYSTLIIYLALIVSTLYFFEFKELTKAILDKRIHYAIGISILAASISTIIAILISVPSAYALSRYKFRYQYLIDIFLELPMIISPAALGAIILIFFSTPVGMFIRNNIIDVIYTFYGIVVAQFFTVLGICTRLMKSVFDEIPLRYENIARTLGASPFQAFTHITFPLSKKGVLSAVILTWAKSIGEFGATITVAGSMSMKTETLPTAIFMKLSMADIKGTVVIIFILLSISISVLTLTRYLLQSKYHD
jgi:molybdate transport system permease protein